jgi:hypothetical protein
VAPGAARALAASADGAWLAWLHGCVEVRGRYLPPGTAACDLAVARSDGSGAPAPVARAVTSLPQGLVAAPVGSAFAVLADYDYEAGAGTLLLVRDGEAREIAKGVTFHGFAPRSPVLVAVAAGELLVVGRDGAVRPTGARPFATFDLVTLEGGDVVGLARGPAERGGELHALDTRHEPSVRGPVARGTAEYRAAPGAVAWTAVGGGGSDLWLLRERNSRRLAGGARHFAFAPGGGALAWISEAAPGRQGDLHAAPVDGAPVRLAGEVGEHRWALSAPRLAWLEAYEPRTRSGVVGTGGPGLPTRTYGKDVTDFELSADGAHLAFLRHTTAGGYSVDLELADTGAAAGVPTRKVARGVFGFSFSPDGAWLYYRTRCTLNGEACDLERVPAAAASPARAEAIAAGVKSFEFDPRDPSRLLVTWQRADLVALDVGVWQGGALVRVDQGALPGSVRFLGPDSGRLAYAVVQPKRAGVYVAALPAATRAPDP